MRRFGVDLEEKQEPRGASVAEAQNGDSMDYQGELDTSRDREAWIIRASLTLAAIEKQSVAVDNQAT
jgi:hypothetical protein